MSEVIVVTSGKGGVGKTTTTANIGTGLALAGNKVVLIDTDIGLRNLDVVMGLENRIVYDLVDVVEGFCRVKQALIKDKRYEGLYLLPAAQTRDKSAVSPQQMMKLCQELKEEFDYIIIDCPAGIEQGFKNAIAGADKAIVVTTPEVSAVRDADRIIGLLEANELKNPKLLINRLRIDMVKRGDMMTIDDIIDILAIGLIGVVPDDEKIVVSTNRGEPAINDEKSVAGQAYRNIVKRIMGQEVPFMNLEDDSGFMFKLKKLFGLQAN
jgi:septum site-determining protein MinD